MLTFSVCGIRCRVSLLFPALITALLICQQDTIIVVCFVASVAHEMGHLLAMLIFRVPPKECVLGLFGVRIGLVNHMRSYRRNLWIALAGPVTNMLSFGLLLLLSMYEAAAVHFCLAVLNLLPVTVLDGGEILRCILMECGKETDSILRFTSAFTIFLILSLGFWIALDRRGGLTLLIVGIYLAVMVFFLDKNEKNS